MDVEEVGVVGERRLVEEGVGNVGRVSSEISHFASGITVTKYGEVYPFGVGACVFDFSDLGVTNRG